MCGGYYEEEMRGPSTEFASLPVFGKAAVVCEIENIECNLDPYKKRIHFRNAAAEERFTIAWLKYINKKQQRGCNG